MTWQATTEDTWLCTKLLEGSGIATPPTVAVIDRGHRTYPATRTVRTATELRETVLGHLKETGPLFGKENRGVSGFGTFLVLDADHDRLHLQGEGWFTWEDFLTHLAGDTSYLLQPAVRNDPFLDRWTAHLATVRICLLVRDAGPRIPFAVLKVPAAGNTSDHFWRKGNLACNVDPEAGTILGARTKDALGTTDYTEHPDTGAALVGETLPRWNEVLKLARECATIFAPVRYQSMDVAITPDGPVLIEINTGGGFDLPQLASGEGFLTGEVLAFFAECGVRLKGRGAGRGAR